MGSMSARARACLSMVSSLGVVGWAGKLTQGDGWGMPGAAARAGLMSALMAQHGFTASARALEGPRGLDGENLAGHLRAAGVTEGADSSITTWASPAEAYAAARARAGDGDRIVVFGSFLTVAGVVSYLRSAATTRNG